MSTVEKVSDFTRRAFPERQIYHRSGGTVRYFTISPLQQIILSAAAATLAGWCLFASISVLFGGSGVVGDASRGEVNMLERWNQELRAKEAVSTSQLIQRTEAFQDATIDFQRRHETLATMLEAFKTGSQLEVSALRGNSASLLITASIDDADHRQSQRLAEVEAPLPQVGLSGQVTHIQEQQSLFLDDIEDMAVERAEAARGVLRLTKVGANRIVGGENMGGPEIAFTSLISGEFENPKEAEFAVRVAQVAARMEETRYFESLVEKLPLATPIGVPSRVTSQFGMRTDPFKKRPSWHGGIDMGARWHAPIVAAGPGTVTYAGSRAGYGRVVDIDHGQGFISRYAHLNRVIAKKGQTVAIGDKIGTMGSTGRSTGPHLHYEVLFQGKQYNPVEFLKAGKHVHQD